MLFTTTFTLGENSREILPLEEEGLSYICKYAELNSTFYTGFSWHWHPSLEIDYIADGEVELRTADRVEVIRKGEAFFVNSNVLHDIKIKSPAKKCRIYAHIFEPRFLSGAYNSVLEQKYMIPILKSRELQTFVIRPDHYTSLQMIEKLLAVIELSKTEGFGYEFEIRAKLSEFWCQLLKETEELRSQKLANTTIDIDRIKLMMQYIHAHYMDKLTLDDIASSANISVRECTRCFQRCIEMSPISYLNEYRVRMAADLLLQTDQSILTISENCGFSSSSYLGKVFHETMKCTPREYRKKNAT